MELQDLKRCLALLMEEEWARSISNHIYWCAASSNGDGDLVRDKLVSILNHVTNMHEGHGSKVYDELEKIVLERSLVKDIKNISPAIQTSVLESFRRVLNHFSP
ncbi:hypothetical protein KUTeg_012284 [Tegillarca granosa]|uniref:Uncharacterized protein n=1 Tax=Tegillarca granosa TaxID=220873 RepID=A0ABQ9EZ21_TEGGR|nr:hypothetical protein KUTeg_012284 [Tegillarca granosa]